MIRTSAFSARTEFSVTTGRLREAGTAQFVEIEVKRFPEPLHLAPARSAAIEVRLGGGRSLVVEPGFDAAHLRALLAVVDTLAETEA